jgi:RNA polymerase sigma factor (sigma-70 family)
MMSDYNVQVKVRNNNILKALSEAGYSPGYKFCEECGITYATLNQLINLKLAPVTSDGDIRDCVIKLCEFLNKEPMQLFSEEQMYMALDSNKSFREVSYEEMEAIGIGYSMDENVFLREKVMEAIGKLRPRDAKIIVDRFYNNKPTYQIADELGVSQGRANEIIKRALRIMRGNEMSYKHRKAWESDTDHKSVFLEHFLEDVL